MKSPTKKPQYSEIANTIEFCKDLATMSFQVNQKTTLSCLLENQIYDIIRTSKNNQYDPKAKRQSISNGLDSNDRSDRPADYFPFSRTTAKQKDPLDNSNHFISQSNKITKNQQEPMQNLRTNNNNIFKKEIPNTETLQLKREPFSFKPLGSNGGPKLPKFAIHETNRIWQNTEGDEISLVPELHNSNNPPPEIEDERVKQKFQQQDYSQEYLADQYYVERDKIKSHGVKFGYIANKIRNDSFDTSNNSQIYGKLENEVQRNLMNPVQIDIKSKNRILGNQSKNNNGITSTKLKNTPKNAYTNSREIKKPYNLNEVATTHPDFRKNTLLAGLKSLERVTKTSSGKDIKKIDLNVYNTKYRKSSDRRSNQPSKNEFGQSTIKQMLSKEAGRIKKEIDTIKSNLESYRIVPKNNLILSDPIQKKAKSDKYNNLHTLIRNSLYHQ